MLAPRKKELSKKCDISFSTRAFKQYLDYPKAHLPLYPNTAPTGEIQYQGIEYVVIITEHKNSPTLYVLKHMREYLFQLITNC